MGARPEPRNRLERARRVLSRRAVELLGQSHRIAWLDRLAADAVALRRGARNHGASCGRRAHGVHLLHFRNPDQYFGLLWTWTRAVRPGRSPGTDALHRCGMDRPAHRRAVVARALPLWPARMALAHVDLRTCRAARPRSQDRGIGRLIV